MKNPIPKLNLAVGNLKLYQIQETQCPKVFWGFRSLLCEAYEVVWDFSFRTTTITITIITLTKNNPLLHFGEDIYFAFNYYLMPVIFSPSLYICLLYSNSSNQAKHVFLSDCFRAGGKVQAKQKVHHLHFLKMF